MSRQSQLEMQACSAAPLVAALLLCWVSDASALPSRPWRLCQPDLLCSTRVVINEQSYSDLAMTPDESDWVDYGTLLSTPAHGQVFKVAENRITAQSSDLTREFVSFHVLYDDKGGKVQVHFEYGDKIDTTRGWCTGLPDHPLFQGEDCQPGEHKRLTKIGGLTAYLVSVTTDLTTKDSGQMRDPKSRVCFHATDIDLNANPPRNQTGAQRCVYLRAITATQFPKIYVGGEEAQASNAIVAYVGNSNSVPVSEQGYDLHLEVRAVSLSTALNVEIATRTLGGRVFAELPGQQWSGPTTCMATGLTVGPCSEWNRTLIYRPTAVQTEKVFYINFQSITKFPEVNEFNKPEYSGVSCTGKMGACPNGTDVAKFMLSEIGQKVRVEQWTPRFRFSKGNHTFIMDELQGGTYLGQPLFRDLTVPTNPLIRASPVMKCSDPKNADQDYPLTCVRNPHPAYVNCPMQSFAFVADVACVARERDATLPPDCTKDAITRATAGLTFELTSAKSTSGTAMDAVKMGLKLSERLFVQEPISEVTDNPLEPGTYVEVNYLAHVAVTWTPPPEAMGYVFNVCVDAKSAKGVVSRCIPVEVKRCFYCTVKSETLHTIAAKFQTNWMQIWSANHERMAEVLELNTVGTKPWRKTKNPNDIEPGTLIRLGPVYHIPVLTEVGWLLEEFRTSRESLLLANPNISPAATHIQADESVCVLPDICTQEREEWMRPQTKDSFFP